MEMAEWGDQAGCSYHYPMKLCTGRARLRALDIRVSSPVVPVAHREP